MSDIQEQIKARFKELDVGPTFNSMAVRKQLAMEFGGYFNSVGVTDAYQMVCYYLRVRGTDGRKTYTTRQLRQLALMTGPEKVKYAAQTAKSVQAVNAAIKRYKDGLDTSAAKPGKLAAALDLINTQGYIDISIPVQLKAAGLNGVQLNTSRRTLAVKYKLGLRAPNTLYHPATGRRYLMSLAEQQSMLSGTDRYLRRCSAAIKEGWQEGTQDPIEDAWDEPVDLDTLTRRKRAPKQPKALSLATALQKHIAEHGAPAKLEDTQRVCDTLKKVCDDLTAGMVLHNIDRLEV